LKTSSTLVGSELEGRLAVATSVRSLVAALTALLICALGTAVAPARAGGGFPPPIDFCASGPADTTFTISGTIGAVPNPSWSNTYDQKATLCKKWVVDINAQAALFGVPPYLTWYNHAQLRLGAGSLAQAGIGLYDAGMCTSAKGGLTLYHYNGSSFVSVGSESFHGLWNPSVGCQWARTGGSILPNSGDYFTLCNVAAAVPPELYRVALWGTATGTGGVGPLPAAVSGRLAAPGNNCY